MPEKFSGVDLSLRQGQGDKTDSLPPPKKNRGMRKSLFLFTQWLYPLKARSVNPSLFDSKIMIFRKL